MAKQIRQTELCYNEKIEEYQVKLFIDGIYQKGFDFSTPDLNEARRKEVLMKKQLIQEDFCKEALKKDFQVKPESVEWPIYNEIGDLLGWLELKENQDLPKVLCIQDQAFVQIKVPRIACGRKEND